MATWIDWLAGWLVRLIGVGGLLWMLLRVYLALWDKVLLTRTFKRELIAFALEKARKRSRETARPLPTELGPDPRRPLD